jgi:hypothetical protein
MDRVIAGDDGRRPHVTDSTSWPSRNAAPITRQPVPAPARPRSASATAVTGIGQGALIPAPQPSSRCVATCPGARTPNGSPGTCSRTATRAP